MAGDKDPVAAAAVLAGVFPCPDEGPGHVLDVGGVLDPGGQSVARQHSHHTAPGQGTPEGAVDRHAEESFLVAEHPAPAVDEDDHRAVLLALGPINVELVPV